MERLRAKLKSESGASITYALLLFLVCAVLSSIILVASTAASGRISNLTKTDQRYYSVTSAAELVKNEIAGKNVRITKYSDDRGLVIEGKGNDNTYSQSGVSELLSDLVKSIDESENGSGNKKLELIVNPQHSDSIKIAIDEAWDNEGMLNINVYNSDGAKPFRINLAFIESSSSKSLNPYPEGSMMEEVVADDIEYIRVYEFDLLGMATTD